jgi:hypothetical protein
MRSETKVSRVNWVCLFGLSLLIFLYFLGPYPAEAQTATGAITGTVTDPKGFSVAEATVVVRNQDTETESIFLTNSAGFYVAPYVQPGSYQLKTTKNGFETVVHKNVVVHVGDRLTIDVQLPLQVQQISVVVTEDTVVLETSKTDHSQTVTQDQVGGLPIATRRWENFVLLTPAVTTDGSSGLSSFRGISGLYNGNSVDGANNSQAFFSEARGRSIIVTYVYSPDSIREFQVSSSNYSAELGQAAGGVVNAVTRSGTNQLHGDLFYNLRYPDLNALDPFGKTRGVTTQTVHQQNQFGGSVGGAILKEKLFFFGTYDGFRKVNPILYLSTTSNATINAFSCPAAVTATQCSAAKTFIATDLLGAFPRNLKQDVFLGKLDYELNHSNHLNAVFNLQNWQEPYGYNTAPSVTNGGATQNGAGGTHERFFIANWTSTFSNNRVNEVRYQWGRDFEFDNTNSGGPSAFLLNIASYGETSALPRPAFPDEHRNQISDNLSIVKGTHLMKMGVDLNFIHELLINLFQGDGNYNYTSTTFTVGGVPVCPAGANATFCRWVADAVGADVGDGLAGKHYSTFTQVNDPITHVGKDDFYNNDFAAYFEDTWKLRPRLTLNLGVRYDLQHVPAPPMPNTATPLLTLYTSTLNIDKNNIAPRLGLAWQFAKNTMLRAGYGIFYGKTSNSTYYALRVENGVFQQTFSGCGPNQNASCAPTFPNVFFTPPGPAPAAPFPGALTPTVGIPGGTLPASSAAAHGMTPDFVNPAAHEGELAIERELPWRMTVSATYLLTRGLHLPASYDANVAPTTATQSYDVLNSSLTATALTATVPFYTARIDNGTGIILNQASVINSWYNGLVLTLKKPMSHDVELLFNYTYSKALDDGETAGTNGTFFGTDGILDPYNLKRDYALSDLDQRHRFVGSIIWEPTYAKGFSNTFARHLLNEWSMSTIVTTATGQPYSASIATFTPAGAVDGGMTGAEVSTFASATGGRVSWLARNPFNLPNFTNVDFRLGRAISFHEKYRLSLVVDAFNLFNQTIVSAVNTTAYTFSGPGKGACVGHTNGCLLPSTSFGSRTTTSGVLYGARQMQFGARFSF